MTLRTSPLEGSLHAACALALLGAWLFSCSAPPSTSDAPALPPVQYVGVATDEALERLLALPVVEIAAGSWTIVSPAPDATSSGAQPFTISVEHSSSANAASTRPASRFARSHVRSLSSIPALVRFFSPVSLAHAHGVPFNGRAFYFLIQDAAAQPRLRIFSERTSLTVDAARSAELRAVRQPLTLQVITAVFEQNEVSQGSGPFLLEPVHFRCE